MEQKEDHQAYRTIDGATVRPLRHIASQIPHTAPVAIENLPSMANPVSELYTKAAAFGTVPLDEFVNLLGSQKAKSQIVRRSNTRNQSASSFQMPNGLGDDQAPDELNINFSPDMVGLVPKDRFTKIDTINAFLRTTGTTKLPFHVIIFNIAQLTTAYPRIFKHTGVMWITDDVLKVNMKSLAITIGVAQNSRALAAEQGSFIAHGFSPVKKADLQNSKQLKDVDGIRVRLFRHKSPNFSRDADESDILFCKWRNPRD